MIVGKRISFSPPLDVENLEILMGVVLFYPHDIPQKVLRDQALSPPNGSQLMSDEEQHGRENSQDFAAIHDV